jgi:serine protease Do
MDKKEKSVVEKKAKSKKPNKQVLMFVGIFLITLGLLLLVFLSGYLAITYSSAIREYALDVDKQGEQVSVEKEFVVTEAEMSVINIVEQAGHSVVSIAVSRLTLSPEQGLIDQSQNIGTGFVVGKDGVIITNQHVVSDLSADYIVVTQDGQEYGVVEILRDDLNDIAIIKVDTEEKELTPLILGDSDTLLVGQSVVAIGTPLGQYAGSVTTGIISGLERSVTASSGWFGATAKTYEGVIQTDAAVNPGNSGGPLINSQGEVVGINFATTAGADNISFAIPINRVKSRLEEYRTYGKFIRPYLGVTYQMISQYEALYYADVVPGALILRVEPTSPAYQGGIRRGDIIVKFGEDDVDRFLADIIQQYQVGEEVEITVFREGDEEMLEIILGEMD